MKKYLGVVSYLVFLALSLVWFVVYWNDIGVVPVQQKFFITSRQWLIPYLIIGFVLSFVVLPAGFAWYDKKHGDTKKPGDAHGGYIYPMVAFSVLFCTLGEPDVTFLYAFGLEYLEILGGVISAAFVFGIIRQIAFSLGLFKPKTNAPQTIS